MMLLHTGITCGAISRKTKAGRVAFYAVKNTPSRAVLQSLPGAKCLDGNLIGASLRAVKSVCRVLTETWFLILGPLGPSHELKLCLTMSKFQSLDHISMDASLLQCLIPCICR